MKAFMDKDFMLQSATARHLYHDYAAAMPSAFCPTGNGFMESNVPG